MMGGRMMQGDAKATQPSGVVVWNRIPSIVQEMILRELANDYDFNSTEDKQRRANYATVCIQWQEFFESINFRKLVLHPSALVDLEQLLLRRRDVLLGPRGGIVTPTKAQRLAGEFPPLAVSRMPRIAHIWLRVVLLDYDCNPLEHGRPIHICETVLFSESGNHTAKNNMIFTSALWKLLEILSAWEKSRKGPRQTFTLELSAHSPGDAKHQYQDDPGLQDDYPYLADDKIQREYIVRQLSNNSKLTDDMHWFVNGQISYPMSQPGVRDLFERAGAVRLAYPLDLDFDECRLKGTKSIQRSVGRLALPEVKMVSSLLLRRQYYRELSRRTLHQLFRETLTGLRQLRHERWRRPRGYWQDPYHQTIYYSNTWISKSLANAMAPSLESIHLFEDALTLIPRRQTTTRPDPTKQYRPNMLLCVAQSAPNIKHLSVSFLSDAHDCLEITTEDAYAHKSNLAIRRIRRFLPSVKGFPNLESVALTSQHHLRPMATSLNDLLHRAAAAAMKMPRLQIMELWNCGDGHAAVFRYEATGTAESSAARVTWRCSWDHYSTSHIQARVIEAWREVASTHTGRRLAPLVIDPLPRGSYAHCGEVLHHLKLRKSILDPTSYMQARVGAEGEHEPEVTAWKSSTPWTLSR